MVQIQFCFPEKHKITYCLINLQQVSALNHLINYLDSASQLGGVSLRRDHLYQPKRNNGLVFLYLNCV